MIFRNFGYGGQHSEGSTCSEPAPHKVPNLQDMNELIEDMIQYSTDMFIPPNSIEFQIFPSPLAQEDNFNIIIKGHTLKRTNFFDYIVRGLDDEYVVLPYRLPYVRRFSISPEEVIRIAEKFKYCETARSNRNEIGWDIKMKYGRYRLDRYGGDIMMGKSGPYINPVVWYLQRLDL